MNVQLLADIGPMFQLGEREWSVEARSAGRTRNERAATGHGTDKILSPVAFKAELRHGQYGGCFHLAAVFRRQRRKQINEAAAVLTMLPTSVRQRGDEDGRDDNPPDNLYSLNNVR